MNNKDNYQMQLQTMTIKQYENEWPRGCTDFRPIKYISKQLKKSEKEIHALIARHQLHLYFGRYVAWDKLKEVIDGM